MTEQASLFDDVVQPGEFEISDGAQGGKCASCDAPIVWIETDAGKKMPLSLKTRREVSGKPYAQSHFVDCKHAKEWRKPR